MSATLTPPGPKGKLLTGNLTELRHDTLAVLTRCRDYGDVASLRFGLTRVLVLSHPRLIEEVLVTNARNFTKHFGVRMMRRSFGNGLLTSEGDFWLRQRRLIQPAFGRERVPAYAALMAEIADRLTSTWQDGQVLEVYPAMARLTLEIIARAMFGASVSEQAMDIGEAVAILANGAVRRLYSIFRLPRMLPTAASIRRRRAIARLNTILYEIIRKRREAKEARDDLLGRLIGACEDDGTRMTDQQLRDEVFTLFIAGHDTTALTLTWGLYLLARHPEAARSLAKEVDDVVGDRRPCAEDLPRLRYTDMVVREVMRLYPSAYAIGRQAIGPCDLGEYRVPAGGTVLMSQWAVHRDPRWYDEPDQFLPERWADGLERRLPRFAYFPFGGGPRVCIGNHFALMEAVLVLASLARDWRVGVPSGEAPICPRPLITLRPAGPVRLTMHRRRTGEGRD